MGIFSCAVIKERRYWHSVVTGKEKEDNLFLGGGGDGGDIFHTGKIVDDCYLKIMGYEGA